MRHIVLRSVNCRFGMTEQQGEVRKVLSNADSRVEEVSQKLVQELGAPDLYLGRLRRGLQLPKF